VPALPQHRNTASPFQPSDVASLNSCKRVGPRSSQADNNVDPRDRLNVWPCFADSMMARAKAHRKAEYTNATAPALPGLKQKASAGKKQNQKP
jgi:hypothetical protein